MNKLDPHYVDNYDCLLCTNDFPVTQQPTKCLTVQYWSPSCPKLKSDYLQTHHFASYLQSHGRPVLTNGHVPYNSQMLHQNEQRMNELVDALHLMTGQINWHQVVPQDRQELFAGDPLQYKRFLDVLMLIMPAVCSYEGCLKSNGTV